MFYEDVRAFAAVAVAPGPAPADPQRGQQGEARAKSSAASTIAARSASGSAGSSRTAALSFEVVEADHAERELRQPQGRQLRDRAGRHTQSRITLTTRYERKLPPAWIWEPIERKVIHTLHGHVLEGMRRKAEVPELKEKPIEPVSTADRRSTHAQGGLQLWTLDFGPWTCLPGGYAMRQPRRPIPVPPATSFRSAGCSSC